MSCGFRESRPSPASIVAVEEVLALYTGVDDDCYALRIIQRTVIIS